MWPGYDFITRHGQLINSFQNTELIPRLKGLRLYRNDVNEQQGCSLMTLLHYACQFGDKEEVEELLNAGSDIFSKDCNGNLPLHYLVTCTNNIEIFELIYQKASDDSERKKLITEKNASGFSPLLCAYESNHFDMAEHLEKLLNCFEINYKNDLLELYETNGIDFEALNKRSSDEHIGSKVLLQAAESDDTDLLKKRLQINIRYINKVNNSGYDPIRIAISHDNVENVKVLLPYSRIDTERYKNIFSVAIEHNAISVIKYLLYVADDVKVTRENFQNENDFKDGTVVDLCRRKVLVQQHYKILSTPLHDVARTGNTPIFQIISGFYEDVNLRNRDLQTPMHIAAKNKNKEIFQLIFKRSSFSLHLNDRNDETPFSIICKNNLTEFLEFVTENSTLYKDSNRRKHFFNLAIKTRCVWLLQFVMNKRNIMKDDFYLTEENIKKEAKLEYDIYQDNQTCLKLAIKEGFIDGVLYLLKRYDWDITFRRQYPSQRNSDIRSPMQLLIEYMPDMAKILFDQCLTREQHFINYGLINDDFYHFNDNIFNEIIEVKKWKANNRNDEKQETASYSKTKENGELTSLLISDSTEREKISMKEDSRKQNLPFSQTFKTHPLTLMIKHQRYSLLYHPFVDSYIDLKWNKFAKTGYYGLCFIYLLIVFGLTTLTIVAKPNFTLSDDSANNETLTENERLNNSSIKIISGCFITLIFIFQSALLSARYKLYQNFDLKYRWIELLTIVLSLFTSFPICIYIDFQTQWYIIVIINFCAWITLLNYIKKHPRFGVYVVMIIYVFTSFLQFAPIFIIVLLPFVVLFYVLLSEKTGIFAFFDTFIHTLVMMIGEFDYKDIIATKESFVTSAMFCLFLFAVTIFLMNLLTGLAVSDTAKILEEAVLTRKIMQIETIHHVEMIMPEWIRKKYWDGFCKEPKEISEIEKATHRFTNPGFRKLFKWWGMSKEAARKIDNGNPVEDKLVALEQKFDQSINNLNEKMNDIIELLKRR